MEIKVKQKNNLSIIDKLQRFKDKRVSIIDLLVFCTEENCSDLYIKVDEFPYISVFGNILRLDCAPTTKGDWSEFYDNYVKNEYNKDYVRQKTFDLSISVVTPETSPLYATDRLLRYRANLSFSEGLNICTFRMIRPEPPTFDTINYPVECKDVLEMAMKDRSAITLFTGPTGSGKSTSYAACINSFTKQGGVLDNKVIITLEDPIEYQFHSTDTCKITQKEMRKDFLSFGDGVISALREHPNCINVGEIRGKQEISALVEAARTGHQVASTIHSSDVASTIARLMYYLDSDSMVLYDLLVHMKLIISQRLIKSNNAYIVDCQYVYFTDNVTKKLLDVVNHGGNVQLAIMDMFTNEKLINNKTVKNFTYEEK